MGEFEFGRPDMLWWLFAVPVILLIYWALLRLRRYKLRRMGNPSTLGELMPDYSAVRGWIRIILFALAVTMAICALARPRTGAQVMSERREGREIVLVVDVSNSMLAEDIHPNRMEYTRRAISQLLGKLKNDGIGVVAFADEPRVVMPVTSEYKSVKARVNSLRPSLISNQGTNLGDAIDVAVASFTSPIVSQNSGEAPQEKHKADDDKRSRVMIIITDGEAHDERALRAAQKAAEDGITICCIGIGSPEGEMLTINGEPQKFDDEYVVTSLNEDLLIQIADIGNGIYTHSDGDDLGFETIMSRLDSIDKMQLHKMQYIAFDEQYQWFLGAALLLLIAQMLVLPRRNPLLRNVNLFDRKSDNK